MTVFALHIDIQKSPMPRNRSGHRGYCFISPFPSPIYKSSFSLTLSAP